MAIKNFKNRSSEELAGGVNNKRTQALLPTELHKGALKKLQIIRASKRLDDLMNFPGLRLEKLKGKRREEYSIRINDKYRICFKWSEGNAFDVVIEDYH